MYALPLIFFVFMLPLTFSVNVDNHAKFTLPLLKKTAENDLTGQNPPNRKPLFTFKHFSTIYRSDIFNDFKIYHANAWNEFVGISCPEHHVPYYLVHHIFSAIYVCLPVPHVLEPLYTAYELILGETNFWIFCGLTGSSSEFAKFTPKDYTDYLILVDSNNKYHLSSKYCVGHMYQVGPDNKEIMTLNYTVNDHSVTLDLPSEHCKILPLPISKLDFTLLPIEVDVKSSVDVLDCLRVERSSNLHPEKPFFELALDDTTLLTYNTSTNGSHNFAYIWFSNHQFPTKTFHISSAVNVNPLSWIITGLMSFFYPLLDMLLSSILYIFESVLDIFESHTFLDLFDRLLNVVITILTRIFQFFVSTIFPRIVDLLNRIPTRYKFLFGLMFVLYLKTTKLLFSFCITVLVHFCIK